MEDDETAGGGVASVPRLADLGGDGICVTDLEGRIRFVNNQLVRLVGQGEDALYGRSLSDFVADDISDLWREFVDGDSRVESGEFQLVRVDGTALAVQVTAAHLGDSEFAGVVLAVRDLTEAIEEARRSARREQSLSVLLTNVTGMVYSCVAEDDGSERLEFASDGAEALTGWTAPELTGGAGVFRHGQLVEPSDRPRVAEEIARATRARGPFTVEYRLLRRDGSTRWVLDRSAFVEPTPDEPSRREGLVMDITPLVESRMAVRASEHRFRALVDGFPGGIVVTQQGRVVLANRAAADLFGLAPPELVGEPVLRFVAPEDHERANQAARTLEGEGTSPPASVRYSVITAAGARREVEAMHFATVFDGGPASQTVFWDITDASRSDALQRAHEQVVEGMSRGDPLATLLETITSTVDVVLPGRVAAILLFDGHRLRYAAGHERLPPQIHELTGDLPVDPPLTPCAEAVREKRVVAVDDLAASASATHPALAAAAAAADIHSCWCSPILDGTGDVRGTLAVYGHAPGLPTPDDLLIAGQLHHLAAIAIESDEMRRGISAKHLDGLTQLATRSLALEILEVELAEVRAGRVASMAVLLLDLDDFSVFNETLGADAGDGILRAVADLLATVVERERIARVGSDAFLIRVPGEASEAALDELVGRVQAVLAAPFAAGGRELYLSASLGVAVSVEGRETAVGLLAGAEAALHHARASGHGGSLRIDDRLRRQARRRVELLPALRRAIDGEELRLQYQPQVELGSGSVVGVEALVRWMHPRDGLLAPNDFVPAAESTGLILPLGHWVLREACRQAARWRDLRPERPLSVAVNLSARQLADPTLAEKVEEALEASSLDPGRLRLELTETAVMADAASAEIALRRLRALGVRLSIDDFGTGYSSLVYLKRLPVDELKIDRSFVDGLDRRPDDSAIVAGIIRLAESLGITTVAEGVERLEQASELVRLGCPVGQGFLWMRPGEAEEVDAILNEGTTASAIRDSVSSIADTVQVDVDEAFRVAVHELRSPLTIITGYSEMLDEPSILARARPAIQRATRRMEQVLGSLTDVSSIDNGTLRLAIGEHKVADVIQGVVEEMRMALPSATISLETSGSARDQAHHFDRSRIEQVVVNLITNAVRYGPRDGTVQVVVDTTFAHWSCAVLDDGDGVPLEHSGAIFRKYARASRSTSGTGLGLYLARGVVRAHGGDLVYRRTPDARTEFCVTLPTGRR